MRFDSCRDSCRLINGLISMKLELRLMKTPEGDRVMTLLVVIQIVHLTARLIGWSNLLSNDHLAFCSLDKHQNKKCKVIKKLQKKT